MNPKNQSQPKQIKDEKIAPITKGMQSNYSHYVASPNSWNYLENLDCDTSGILMTRKQSTFLSNTTNPLQGVGFTPYSGGFFLVKTGNDCYRINADGSSVFLSVGAFATNGSYGRFNSVNGITFMVSAGNNIYYTPNGGITWTVAPNLVNTGSVGAPVSNTQNVLINAGFAGRIWTASSNASSFGAALFYSEIIPSTAETTSYTTPSYIVINTQAENLTALMDYDTVLYVFSNSFIFRVYNTQSQDNSPIYNIGAISQEVVLRAFDSVFFMHQTGIYRIFKGTITKISQDINNLFDYLYLSIANVATPIYSCFSWFDIDSVYFSIDLGTDTVGKPGATTPDRTYVLKFNVYYKTWSIISFKDVQLTCALSAFHNENTNQNTNNTIPNTILGAFNLTNSQNFLGEFSSFPMYQGIKPFEGIQTLGDWGPTPSALTRGIYCRGVTQWQTFGEENHYKGIDGLSMASLNGAGFKLFYQIDNQDLQKANGMDGVWTEIGSLSSNYITFFRNFQSKHFYRIRFAVAGESLGVETKLGEMAFLSVSDYGYGQN